MKSDPLAVYGAVMGTLGSVTAVIAIYLQWRQWREDRAKLEVEGQILIEHTKRLVVVLTVHAVNVGRRPVRIREIAAYLAKSPPFIPLGLTPEKADEMRRILETSNQESKLAIFGFKGESALELKPDGGETVWKMEIPEGLQFLSERENGEKYGNGYVMLTSQKKIPFRFLLLLEDKWPIG